MHSGLEKGHSRRSDTRKPLPTARGNQEMEAPLLSAESKHLWQTITCEAASLVNGHDGSTIKRCTGQSTAQPTGDIPPLGTEMMATVQQSPSPAPKRAPLQLQPPRFSAGEPTSDQERGGSSGDASAPDLPAEKQQHSVSNCQHQAGPGDSSGNAAVLSTPFLASVPQLRGMHPGGGLVQQASLLLSQTGNPFARPTSPQPSAPRLEHTQHRLMPSLLLPATPQGDVQTAELQLAAAELSGAASQHDHHRPQHHPFSHPSHGHPHVTAHPEANSGAFTYQWQLSPAAVWPGVPFRPVLEILSEALGSFPAAAHRPPPAQAQGTHAIIPPALPPAQADMPHAQMLTHFRPLASPVKGAECCASWPSPRAPQSPSDSVLAPLAAVLNSDPGLQQHAAGGSQLPVMEGGHAQEQQQHLQQTSHVAVASHAGARVAAERLPLTGTRPLLQPCREPRPPPPLAFAARRSPARQPGAGLPAPGAPALHASPAQHEREPQLGGLLDLHAFRSSADFPADWLDIARQGTSPRAAAGFTVQPCATDVAAAGASSDEGWDTRDDVAFWRPMSDADKHKCNRAYREKGYEALGGVGPADARALHARSSVAAPFGTLWDAAHLCGAGRLGRAEFCLFMACLKAAQAGRPVPRRISLSQASWRGCNLNVLKAALNTAARLTGVPMEELTHQVAGSAAARASAAAPGREPDGTTAAVLHSTALGPNEAAASSSAWLPKCATSPPADPPPPPQREAPPSQGSHHQGPAPNVGTPLHHATVAPHQRAYSGRQPAPLLSPATQSAAHAAAAGSPLFWQPLHRSLIGTRTGGSGPPTTGALPTTTLLQRGGYGQAGSCAEHLQHSMQASCAAPAPAQQLGRPAVPSQEEGPGGSLIRPAPDACGTHMAEASGSVRGPQADPAPRQSDGERHLPQPPDLAAGPARRLWATAGDTQLTQIRGTWQNGEPSVWETFAEEEEWQQIKGASPVDNCSGTSQKGPLSSRPFGLPQPLHALSGPSAWAAGNKRDLATGLPADCRQQQQRLGLGTWPAQRFTTRVFTALASGCRSSSWQLTSTWADPALQQDVSSPQCATPAPPTTAAPRPGSAEQLPLHVRMHRQPPPAPTSPARPPGWRRLAVRVERAQLDYRKPLDRPFFSLALRAGDGHALEPVQDTPPGHLNRSAHSVDAHHTVVLRTPIGHIPQDAVLYVELKHWKSASRKMSLLGWSAAPWEALVDASLGGNEDEPRARHGQLTLHLWRKPLKLLQAAEKETPLAQPRALHPYEHDLFLTLGEA